MEIETVIEKYSAESRGIGFDFSNFPESISGDVIVSSTVFANPGTISLTEPVVATGTRDGIPAGQCVTATVSGGFVGVRYSLACLAEFASGAICEIRGIIKVI